MKIKVAKFGGSSLSNAQQFRKVEQIILADKNRKYIIPSAPGKRSNNDSKITDLLYLCHTQDQHGVNFDNTFAIIVERYQDIVEGLGLSLDLTPYFKTIKMEMKNQSSVDYIASRGEYLNAIILSELLDYKFVDAKDIIKFNKNHTLDPELTNKKIKEHLIIDKGAVIPGFYGALPNGKIKIFPRGGSDITGALIAKGVNSKIYENWTDVPGLLMTDPRIVSDPKPIESITYRELRELSYMGANVLHEETIFPVLDAGIPINIKNTNEPDRPGTIITSYTDPEALGGTITGIAGRKDFTVIAIEKHHMKTEISFMRKLFTILENYNIQVQHIPSGIDSISVVVTDLQLKNNLDRLVEEIQQQCEPDLIEIHPNMALIATVGHGMAYTPGISAKLFTALAKEGINVRMIDQGSSEINIIVGVETEDFERAIRAIYNAFV